MAVGRVAVRCLCCGRPMEERVRAWRCEVCGLILDRQTWTYGWARTKPGGTKQWMSWPVETPAGSLLVLEGREA